MAQLRVEELPRWREQTVTAYWLGKRIEHFSSPNVSFESSRLVERAIWNAGVLAG